MIYRGREVDVLALWGQYVDLPNNLGDPLPTYLPKVKCPNPEHDTYKRHFQINTRKPWVHCFAECGLSGTYEHALAILNNLYTEEGKPDVKRARRLILSHTRVATKGIAPKAAGLGTRKSHAHDSAVAKDEKLLRAGEFRFLPKLARNYLDQRGIDSSARGKWEVGWDEETERIVIPAYDERGTFRFLIRREILRKTSMKYHYTDGALKTGILFGACYLDRALVEEVGLVLCEGPLDVIRMHTLGITNAVAILGSGISRQQVRLIDGLDPRRVYLLFDADSAGVYNIVVAWKGKEGRHRGLAKYPLLVCRYPTGKDDPGELNRKEVERSIEKAIPVVRFIRKARDAGLALTTGGN